ncbi:uncharacterized protein LOC110023423 [Phalaenopsis equestris]|uniref:uncharacterized protein LOC110023423 n=1 Tax=Phalaenopsis equestris TaxID=78828 RepID=UPI0009E52636|nr:uncharacterized protein LOC110023423 [Phalaenopsis equestris]
MMATKSTTSNRDRKNIPSPAQRSLKTSLTRGDSTCPSPPEGKKPLTNPLNPKAFPSPLSQPKRIPIVSTITSGSTSKTRAGRKLADKAPSTLTLQRSMKTATPTPKLRSSSVLRGDKAAPTGSRTAKSSLFRKAKSSRPTLVRKKEAPFTMAAPSEVRTSSDHDAATAFERPVQEQMWNHHEKVVGALNELNEEEIKFVSSLVDEENLTDEYKSGEPEDLGEGLASQVFDEVSKGPILLEEIPERDGVVVVSTMVEKRGEEKKLEHVNAGVRLVDPEATAASVVTEMPVMKKKDVPMSNDVIEETKSKLMETRKNKVLALVGAFETVFSLQKPDRQQIQRAFQVQHERQI